MWNHYRQILKKWAKSNYANKRDYKSRNKQKKQTILEKSKADLQLHGGNSNQKQIQWKAIWNYTKSAKTWQISVKNLKKACWTHKFTREIYLQLSTIDNKLYLNRVLGDAGQK